MADRENHSVEKYKAVKQLTRCICWFVQKMVIDGTCLLWNCLRELSYLQYTMQTHYIILNIVPETWQKPKLAKNYNPKG